MIWFDEIYSSSQNSLLYPIALVVMCNSVKMSYDTPSQRSDQPYCGRSSRSLIARTAGMKHEDEPYPITSLRNMISMKWNNQKVKTAFLLVSTGALTAVTLMGNGPLPR